MIAPIHPFPARMAPEVALQKLRQLPEGSLVLDPMAGSGTVLRHAVELGHQAVGFDSDPLAVLMARVWTTPVDDEAIRTLGDDVVEEARDIRLADIDLPWIDDDTETARFVRYWFGYAQRRELRRISWVLDDLARRSLAPEQKLAADALRVALSRIIVTKDQGASLGRDISHSRPHKVVDQSNYKVFPNFERSIVMVRNKLLREPPPHRAAISLGDARNLSELQEGSIDAVLTSPPYLNAIDYLRGHRLSLVWLGHSMQALRTMRSEAIGTERSAKSNDPDAELAEMKASMGVTSKNLPSRFQGMIHRYVQDIRSVVLEMTRVLRTGGSATFVMGNSCLKSVFIRNSRALAKAAEFCGLELVKRSTRRLPVRRRYLPVTGEALSKRMRTETVLQFVKV